MNREEAAKNPVDLAIWEFENAIKGTEENDSEYPNYFIHIDEYKTALKALLWMKGLPRIDTPPGNDSVRASTGFQRDGGDKTESRCNQCIHCGQGMPEGDQVCGHCRRQHGY